MTEVPFVIFAMFGEGESRWEASGGQFIIRALSKSIFLFRPSFVYLSSKQHYCSWHIQLSFPFFFAFHFIYNKKSRYFGIGKRRTLDGFSAFGIHTNGWR